MRGKNRLTKIGGETQPFFPRFILLLAQWTLGQGLLVVYELIELKVQIPPLNPPPGSKGNIIIIYKLPDTLYIPGLVSPDPWVIVREVQDLKIS